MKDIFKVLFCANISLEQLTYILDYDEETLIKILEKKLEATEEDKSTLENLVNEKLYI